MIYRSAQIDSIPPCSRQELKNMGIRTIIDLRSENERHNYPQLHDDEFNIIHIPILTGNMEEILQGIQEEKIKSDTIYRLVEQMNRELVYKLPKGIQKAVHRPSRPYSLSGCDSLYIRERGVQGSFPPYCLPLLESTKTSLWKTIV